METFNIRFTNYGDGIGHCFIGNFEVSKYAIDNMLHPEAHDRYVVRSMIYGIAPEKNRCNTEEESKSICRGIAACFIKSLRGEVEFPNVTSF